MGVDWNQIEVQTAIRQYENGELKTLEELRKRVEEVTGKKVGKTTVHSRVTGLAKQNGPGQPRKRERPLTSPTECLEIGPISSPVLCRATSSKNEKKCITPTPKTRPETLSGPKLTLSKKLTETALLVPDKKGLVRVFRKTKESEDGRTHYFRCSKCSSLKDKLKAGKEVYLKVRDGEIIGSETNAHYPDCLPITEAKAVAQEMDRKCRLNVRKGLQQPRQAWKQGHDTLVQMVLGTPNERGPESLPAEFSPWSRVRGSYNRQRSSIHPPITDAYNYYQCDKCPSRQSTVQHRLKEHPIALVMHLKRFRYDRLLGARTKVADPVQIPLFISLSNVSLSWPRMSHGQQTGLLDQFPACVFPAARP